MQEDAERLGANAIVRAHQPLCHARLFGDFSLWHSSYRKVMALIIGGIILILLIYLIAKRINDKEKENFEKRKN